MIAFTQYPQYRLLAFETLFLQNLFSCATTGSSLNHIARLYNQMGEKPSSTWSVIDRWPKHEGLIDAFVECVKAGLEQIPEEDRHKVRDSCFSS